jgi:hypothetical protein
MTRLKATPKGALRGLDPFIRTPAFWLSYSGSGGVLTGNQACKKGMKSEGGETSHPVNFYLLPRRYAPRLQCLDEPRYFIFRYN